MKPSISQSSTSKKAKSFTQTSLKHVLIFYSLAFIIPLILNPSPTSIWFTGIAVNATLISACFYLNKSSLIPLSILPSVGMATRGIAIGFVPFGQLTFLPFIWIGNLALVFLFKSLSFKKGMNRSVALLLSVIAKVFIIFTSAYMIYSINSLSQTFLNAMGLMQVVSALTGGFLALGIQKFKK